MKLDKIKFAQVIAYMSRIGCNIGMDEVVDLDNLIDMPIPDAPKSSCTDVNSLLKEMALGAKIPAIKAYRVLTGAGLLESKNAVEKYWLSDNVKRIQDALGTAETGDALVEVARNAHRAELELSSQHNEPATLGDILDTAKSNLDVENFGIRNA